MTLDLSLIAPNILHTLDGAGFLFGAGTSLEAGYPLMPELTRKTIAGLDTTERGTLNEVLSAAGVSYDDTTATPNIEQISDYVIAHGVNSGESRFRDLETKLRELILKCILEVHNPALDNHCLFLEKLKRRAFGIPCSVWIFTTNYDLLFEAAAARTGVTIENGFSGTTERYFNPSAFRHCTGVANAGRFRANPGLVVKLVKLHGSISWVDESGKLFERHPSAMSTMTKRVMVLPRRKKVIDTLTPPYDALFSETSKVLGNACKYIISCGFSFSDEHINEQLFLPAIKTNRCRLFALTPAETTGMAEYKNYPSFQVAFESLRFVGGNYEAVGTEVWKFSKFVNLF